jgi:hypothetical protein
MMNTTKKALFIALLVAVIFLSKIELNASDNTIYKSIDQQILYQLMIDEGYRVEIAGNKDQPRIKWALRNGDARIIFYRDNQSVQFYAFKPAPAGSDPMEIINGWNSTKRFSRSYVNNDGYLVLELDLSLMGGVTELAIKDFLVTCRVSFNVWSREVSSGED